MEAVFERKVFGTDFYQITFGNFMGLLGTINHCFSYLKIIIHKKLNEK